MTAAEVDLAEVGHTTIVRCWIVIICKKDGEDLMRLGGIDPVSEWAMTQRFKVCGLPPLLQ